MGKKDMLEGAKIVGDAAGAKFEELKEGVGAMREKIDKFSSNQEVVNETLIDRSDEQEERLKALEDNRYFVRMSRHSLDDMTPIEQERLAAWLQKLVLEMQARGFAPSENQQVFLTNIFKNMGLQDELMQIDSLSMLETFGDSSMHEAIYKIFLIICYLHDNSFTVLAQMEDVDQMFKLSASDKTGIRDILENERIPTLGVPGLVGMFDPGKPLNSFKVESIISCHTDICSHLMVQYKLPKSGYETYLKSFAILAPKSGKFTENQRNYLISLAAFFGCPECVYDVDKLCLSPQNVDIKQWQTILDTDEKKYAWVLDGAVLLSLDPSYDYEKNEAIGHALRGLKLASAQDFVSAAVRMPRSSSSSELLENIKHISKHCKSWKHVADFCGLPFKDMFNDLRARLGKYFPDAIKLSFECTSLTMKTMDNRFAPIDFDDGFFSKMASKAGKKLVESGRSSNLKDLVEIKKKAEQLFDDNASLFSEANYMIGVFGVERINFNNPLGYKDFELDHSAENEDWGDDFDRLQELLQKAIDESSNTSELLAEQLSLFEQGKIHTSILTVKQNQQEEKEKIERAERAAKRTVQLNGDGEAKSVSIKWHDMVNIPFEPSDISRIVSDGENWMALVNQVLYFSEDGEQWVSLADKIESGYYDSLAYVNNTWMLAGNSKMLFSEDGNHWQEARLPEGVGWRTPEVYFFGNQWLLIAKEDREYTYKEKGIIFDSDSTRTYDAPVFYTGKSLVGSWEKWGDASTLDEGVVMISTPVAISDRLLIASFEYEWIYANHKKKPTRDPHVAYISENKRWKRATWPQEKHDKCEGAFYFTGDKFIFLANGAIFTSLNGYEWSITASDVSHGGSMLKINDILFILPGYKNTGYLSVDGNNFSEMVVSDSGRWDNFATNGKEIMAVFSPSKHETFLRKGVFVFE